MTGLWPDLSEDAGPEEAILLGELLSGVLLLLELKVMRFRLLVIALRDLVIWEVKKL